MAAPPLTRCPSPSPIHSLRVVRREPSYIGESDGHDAMDGARGGGRDDGVRRRSGHRAPSGAAAGDGVQGHRPDRRHGESVQSHPANGGIAGEQPAGRREINWDGAAAIPFNNRNDFTFADPIIARVRITLGTGALGSNVPDISAGGTVDVVVVDNLIYGEPRRGPGA